MLFPWIIVHPMLNEPDEFFWIFRNISSFGNKASDKLYWHTHSHHVPMRCRGGRKTPAFLECFVRTDLSIPLKSRFSQPLSQVIVLNVSLNFFVPSLRSSLSSSRTNTLLTFTLYLTDYLYSFRAFGHYHKCCFVFCLPTTVSSSQ